MSGLVRGDQHKVITAAAAGNLRMCLFMGSNVSVYLIHTNFWQFDEYYCTLHSGSIQYFIIIYINIAKCNERAIICNTVYYMYISNELHIPINITILLIRYFGNRFHQLSVIKLKYRYHALNISSVYCKKLWRRFSINVIIKILIIIFSKIIPLQKHFTKIGVKKCL